jgi:hypothetical protein
VRALREPSPDIIAPMLEFETEWDGLSDSDWAAIERAGEQIRASMLESINDSFQQSVDEEVQTLIKLPQQLDRQGLREMDRFRQGRDRQTEQ